MDSFFIADKLRGIPLVSGGKNRANNKNDNQETEDNSKRPAIQLEKRDVASSSAAGILFKSAGHTASTSNMRKQTNKPTTANWPTTTTTRRPPTTTRTTTTASRRKQVTIATTSTRKPPATRKLSNQVRQLPLSTTISTSSSTTTTTEASTTSTSITTAGEETSPRSSATTRAEETRTTLKKFDKLINQFNQQQTLAAESNESVNPNTPTIKTTLKPTTTAAQLPLVTQSFNQRRTQQPVLGPQRFNDGRSLSAGPNWVVFNRPDGGYSFFEVCVLLSSIIMVSTIVFVIISNWVKAFKRKRQKRMAKDAAVGSREIDSRSPSMNLQTDGSGGDGDLTRKISMISSGGLTTTTANTTSDATSSTSFSTMATAKPESTLINMATNAAAQVANDAVKTTSNQLISASQNISSEIKQAASNISNKAMAIVQPTENQNAAIAISAATTADSMSVMSDPLADKMSPGKQLIGGGGGGDSSDPKKNINRSVSDLSAAKLKKNSDDKQPLEKVATGEALLEELFNSTAAAPGKVEKQTSDDKKTTKALSRVGSLESIELPPTLIESIKRADGGKNLVPDEAPSPNLLLGEREPAPAKQQKPVASSVVQVRKEPQVADKAAKPDKTATAVKSEPTPSTSELPKKQKQQNNGEKVNGKRKQEEEQRPVNPMGRDEPKKDADPAKLAKSTPRTTAATTSVTTPTTTTIATATATAPTTTATTAEVKNHQVVVNKLDKRKTNLEIVDLRDESVTGKMRGAKDEPCSDSAVGNWISMDGVAVVQPAPGALSGAPSSSSQMAMDQQLIDQQTAPLMSPSEIIESRFHVDYKNKRRVQMGDKTGSKDSNDSKATDYLTNNIESELEQDNKMRNRKYFVYIVHDGHFTAKKECIARIELPQKRRITLAEMRHLIANSQDISLTSLRRNRFKFVTETYRLLNENEDATVLHQVYPTQGVFLKLNIPEQENQTYAFKRGRPTGRLSTGSGGMPSTGSSLGNTTIASRQRAGVNNRQLDNGAGGSGLPAIEVDSYAPSGAQDRTRASSVGRRNRQPAPGGSYRRTKSSLAAANRRQQQQQMTSGQERLPSIGRSPATRREEPQIRKQLAKRVQAQKGKGFANQWERQERASTIGEAATDLGQNVLSGAKKLFNSTFKL